ncbi:hypothetical protein Csa_012839 [Cucumis sativus]|uniref:Uncharacterized protein n=1 Tax=Cucumis sativus TaxID=3659 RepID=A0A0A0L5Q3_CUCSA|nr:hypothetical protein Csa_012839 [Cucumis sativus]
MNEQKKRKSKKHVCIHVSGFLLTAPDLKIQILKTKIGREINRIEWNGMEMKSLRREFQEPKKEMRKPDGNGEEKGA